MHLTVSQRKQLILAILRGEGEAAFDFNNVSALDRTALVAAADRLATQAAARTSPINGYYKLKRRMPLREGYLAASIAAIVPLGCALWIVTHIDVTASENFPLIAAASTLFGVFAAATGWGVASWTAHRNARAQHTLNFLATRFSNSSFSDQAAIFNKAFADHKIDKALISRLATSDDPDDTAALQSLRWLLNWFEFIAVGVILGDLDLTIVTKTVRSNLIFYCDKCLPYIREVQQTQPKILENLIELRLHFQDH